MSFIRPLRKGRAILPQAAHRRASGRLIDLDENTAALLERKFGQTLHQTPSQNGFHPHADAMQPHCQGHTAAGPPILAKLAPQPRLMAHSRSSRCGGQPVTASAQGKARAPARHVPQAQRRICRPATARLQRVYIASAFPSARRGRSEPWTETLASHPPGEWAEKWEVSNISAGHSTFWSGL